MTYQPQKPIEKIRSFTITFSTEELTVIMGMLGVNKLFRFEFPNLTPEEGVIGRDSLVARGILGVGEEGRVTLDRNIMRLISVLAVPAQVLMILPDTNRKTGAFDMYGAIEPQFHFFAKREADFIHYNRSQPGLHTFSSVSDDAYLLLLIGASLGIMSTIEVPEGEPTEKIIDQAFLDELEQERLAGNLEQLEDMLVRDYGIPPTLANSLVFSQGVSVVSYFWQTDYEWGAPYVKGDIDISAYVEMLYKPAGGGLWIRTFDKDNPQQVTFRSASALRWVDDLIGVMKRAPGFLKPTVS